MEKIKIRVDIAKFKVLFFVGVIGASGFLMDRYKTIITLFGHPDITKYIVISLILFLLFYGVAGIIKNIGELSKIKEEL